MSSSPPQDRAALARERLAARARRVALIRRGVVAGTLSTFALAWGVIAYVGPMGQTEATAKTSTTTPRRMRATRRARAARRSRARAARSWGGEVDMGVMLARDRQRSLKEPWGLAGRPGAPVPGPQPANGPGRERADGGRRPRSAGPATPQRAGLVMGPPGRGHGQAARRCRSVRGVAGPIRHLGPTPAPRSERILGRTPPVEQPRKGTRSRGAAPQGACTG